MKVILDLPPNFEQISAVLPASKRFGVLFTYGDAIYNPSKVYIPPQLLDHEQVHMWQQGEDPDAWWFRYLRDEQFRFEQEFEAHCMEFKSYSLGHNRAMRESYLHQVAQRLASPLYGHLIKPGRAKKLIKEQLKNDGRKREDSPESEFGVRPGPLPSAGNSGEST